MSAFDAYVQAKYHGGTMAGGPTFTVIHDAETPLRTGYADSIAEFFRVGPAAGTSAHAMVDPAKAIKMLPDNVVAYAAGPYANPFGWHLEQAGYARFTRADWTTPDGMAQMHRVAPCIREVHDTWGIPKRWCTDDQLRRAAKGDRASGGMTTHQQVARVLGGTTHTDPEDNYPRDLLLPVVLGNTTEDEEIDMSARDDIVGRQDGRIIPSLQLIEASSGAILTVLGPQILGGIAALTALQQQELAEGDKVDVDDIVRRVTAGVTDSVTARLLVAVGDVVRAELGVDNTAQADAIVAALAAKLAA